MPDPIIQITNNVATASVEEGNIVLLNVGLEPVVETVDVGVIGAQGPAGIQGATGPVGGQGATGPSGGTATLSGLTDVDVSSKVNKSVLTWDEGTGKFVANDQNTIITLTDGGNF
jgi:hypothetical protein